MVVVEPLAAAEPVTLVRSAIEAACKAENIGAFERAADVLMRRTGLRLRRPARRPLTGRRQVLADASGRLTIDWIGRRGRLRFVRAQYDGHAGNRPDLLAIADADCRMRAARRLRYDAAGIPSGLDHLNGSLQPTGRGEPLNPPVPPGIDPGGIPVAVIDTGVNYLLPEIAARLARDASGEILGYDYWDLDPRPFDANPIRSAFFPGRHGTAVASLILAEAPIARLLPYRYPRPDMTRMADAIDAAAGHGARLVNLSLASFHRAEWQAFGAAAARHPEVLFVVAAGNDRRDLDHQPVYPAALPLDNMITVTTASSAGRLISGVNWGARTVDLMAPIDDVLTLGFDGRPTRVLGSSFATARVTALAACLLASHPTWAVAALRAAIYARAEPPTESGAVAEGFIPARALGEQSPCGGRPPVSGI